MASKTPKDIAPAPGPVAEAIDEVLDLVDLADPIQLLDEIPAPEPTPEPESSSLLTTTNAELLAEYARRLQETEAKLAEMQAKLAEVTGAPAGPAPWEDPEGRIVYWHPKGFSTLNPVTGKGLEFKRRAMGGFEYRTKHPEEVKWLDRLADPDNPEKKPGLARLTPWPAKEVA